MTSRVSYKRNKVKDLKTKLTKEVKEKDKLASRVEFLERQIVELRQDNPNHQGFIKATIFDDNNQQEYPNKS